MKTVLFVALSFWFGRSFAWNTDFRYERCGPRYDDYIAFHRQNRNAPDAKYLVYACDRAPCAGIGDRIRATMMMMRVAMRHRRVFVIDWTFPSPLTDYFVPNMIDWTPEGIAADKQGSLSLNSFAVSSNSSLYRPWRNDSYFTEITKHHTVVRIVTNDGQVLQEQSRSDLSCVFNILFRPSALLRQGMDEEIAFMYPRAISPFPYVAIHLRMGGLAGEPHAIERQSGKRDIHVIAAALAFSKSLAETRGITEAVAFVSDNDHLRWLLGERFINHAVAPRAGSAHHIDLFVAAEGENATTLFLPEFVEIGVLARSVCLVHSRSGFSAISVWWTNKTCHYEMSDVIARIDDRWASLPK